MAPIRPNEQRWTNEQRLAIFLLTTRFSSLTKDQRSAVLNRAFRADFTQTHAAGLPSSTIEGQLRQRTRQGRAAHWDEIEGVYLAATAEQKTLLDSVLRRLVDAAAALGLEVVPDLLMVHSRRIHLEPNLYTHRAWTPQMPDLVRNTDPAYRYGGKAYRVLTGTVFTDVLVCEPAICASCSSAEQVAANLAVAAWRESPFQELPYVHSGDLALEAGGETGARLYAFEPPPPAGVGWDAGARTHSGGVTRRRFYLWVKFGDGFVRLVVCCHFVGCECGGAARERRRVEAASAEGGEVGDASGTVTDEVQS